MNKYYSASTEPIEIPLFKLNSDIFCNFALCLFSYVNHFAIHTIVKELPNTNRLGLYNIIMRSAYFPMFLYTVITFAGAITCGTEVPYFVILRKALPGESDVMMLIAQLGVFVVILFAIIIKVKCNGELFLYLMRYLNIIKMSRFKEPSFFKKFVINTFLAASAILLSFFIKENVLDVISLFSSITCPFYMFIAPCKIVYNKRSSES